ncbi:MAG: YdaU family protein [Brevundimonas sp.]
MSRRPWYKRYGGDFVLGTMALSLEEKGAYSLCLDLIYDRGGPIPDDARWLAGMCGVSLRKWGALRDRLIATGKLAVVEGCLSNARAEREIAEAADASRDHAENGAKGGRKRAENAAKLKDNSAEAECGSNENKHIGQARLKPNQKPEARDKISDANASSVGGADVQAAFAEWNDLARRLALPVAKDLTPERRKHIRARLATAGLAGWREALAAVEASPHCRGENDRGWRADIDFVANAAKFAKLREGSYAKPAVEPAEAALTGPTFDGPPQLRAAVVERQGEPYARSYLDPASWDAAGRRLIPANAYAVDKLTRDFGDLAKAWRFTIALSADNDHQPPEESAA